MRNEVQSILSKEVDRREFLKHVGLTIVALSGAAAAVRTLTSFGSKAQTTGFGAGVYGGPKTR